MGNFYEFFDSGLFGIGKYKWFDFFLEMVSGKNSIEAGRIYVFDFRKVYN